MKSILSAATILGLAFCSTAEAAGDARKGEALFKARCSTCHAVARETVRRPGPSLAGIARRKAATDPAFTYSKALKTANLTWTPQQLDQFLAAPSKKTPGTFMMIGVPNAQDRADIVAYLSTLKK